MSADFTRAQITDLGTDAVTLMINIMSRNHQENEAIRAGLHESVQHDLDAANAAIDRIRRNVLLVLHRPHTDAMIYDALFEDHDYANPDACA